MQRTGNGATSLVIVYVDGSRLHPLSPLSFAGHVHAGWSPDGTQAWQRVL